MTKKQRIEELEDEVAYLMDLLEEHEEELSVADARLSELEEFMDKMRWAVNNE